MGTVMKHDWCHDVYNDLLRVCGKSGAAGFDLLQYGEAFCGLELLLGGLVVSKHIPFYLEELACGSFAEKYVSSLYSTGWEIGASYTAS